MKITPEDCLAIEYGDVGALNALYERLLGAKENLMTPQADLAGQSIAEYVNDHGDSDTIEWMISKDDDNIPAHELASSEILPPKTSEATDENEEGVKAPVPYDPCVEYSEVWVKGPKVLGGDSSPDFACLADSLGAAVNANQDKNDKLYANKDGKDECSEEKQVPPNYVYVHADGLCFYHAVLWLIKLFQEHGVPLELPILVYTTETEEYAEQRAAAKSLQEVTLEYAKAHLSEFLSESEIKYQSASPNPWADHVMITACAHMLNVNIHFNLYDSALACIDQTLVSTDGAVTTLEMAGINGTHFAPHQTNGDFFGISGASSSSSSSSDAALLSGALPFTSVPF